MTSETKLKILRSILSIVIMTVATYNSLTNFGVTDKETFCIYDYSHLLFKGLNIFLKDHEIIKCSFQVIISLTMDISAIFLSFNWIYKGRTWRPIIETVLFLFLKFLCSSLFQMRYTEDNLFTSCSFPSILVSYYKTNDLFFSSLIGLNLIFATNIEKICSILKKKNRENKLLNVLCIFSYLLIVLQFIIDLSIRSHYIIDEVSGLICAHFCILSTKEVSDFMDQRFPLCEQKYEMDSPKSSSKEIPMMGDESPRRHSIQVVNESYFEN
jgi:hypothetical protein